MSKVQNEEKLMIHKIAKLQQGDLFAANGIVSGDQISFFLPENPEEALLGRVVNISKGMVKLEDLDMNSYLAARTASPDDPLFIAHKSGYIGHRLSTNSIYNLVRERSEQAGISKVMSPHRVRHSAITTALDVSGGDVRRVQKLSRHSSLNTLMIYDDNRVNAQGQMTDLLDGLI